MSEKKAKEATKPTEEAKKPKVDHDEFVARKLKVINEMPKKATAKALAERVIRNKEVQ